MKQSVKSHMATNVETAAQAHSERVSGRDSVDRREDAYEDGVDDDMQGEPGLAYARAETQSAVDVTYAGVSGGDSFVYFFTVPEGREGMAFHDTGFPGDPIGTASADTPESEVRLEGTGRSHRIPTWQRADGNLTDRCRRQRHRRMWPSSRGRPTFASMLLLAMALGLGSSAARAATAYDPPITTLVTNMGQPSSEPPEVSLNSNQTGFAQRFRTGPKAGGYQLEGIWLNVESTRESRYMTINARLYRVSGSGYDHVANLSRGQLNNYAENEWRAPADTYLEPDTEYAFELDCVHGCANDNYARLSTTGSRAEDTGVESGWSIGDFHVFRKGLDTDWLVDRTNVLKIRVKGRVSRYRAYRTEIISRPRDGHTYRLGENIEIALTYNTPVYADQRDPTSIDIRVGDAEDGSDYRTATYASGQFTTRLVFRYQVQLGELDTDGIAVDAGTSTAGYSGWVPTLVYSLGTLPVDRIFPSLPDDARHKVDGSFKVTGAHITSTPAHSGGYRLGEDIEVTLTFSADAHVPGGDSSIAIRVGDAAHVPNYRGARYVSGSGTRRLVYRYRVQDGDHDADGISVDVGGPNSGFGGPLPVTSPELGSVPVERGYSGVADDAGHKVARAITAEFDASALTVSESGTAASITVVLDPAPERAVTIPIAAAPGDGATAADYALSATSLTFAPGETEQSLTVTAVDDGEDDDGETLTIAFGDLPTGIRAGAGSSVVVAISDDDGDVTAQSVTIRQGRNVYIAGLDDIVFNLTLAEPADRATRVNVRLTQDQPFLDTADLLQHGDFAAGATAAELRIPAPGQYSRPARGGALTATLVVGSGYHVGTPAAARVRMAVSTPALIARLSEPRYTFDEGASGAGASVDVVMETQPGLPTPNRSHAVTLATTAGTAAADTDFVPVSVTLTFAPQDYVAEDGRRVARKSVALPPVDDDEEEPDEQLTVTLSRDGSLGDLVQVRNPDRTRCDGPCRATVTITDDDIVIIDDDIVRVAFLDEDGAPLDDLRLAVREGERATYGMILARRPEQSGLLVLEPGEGDADLVPQGDRSWLFTPDPSGNTDPDSVGGGQKGFFWLNTFVVTVEALQDDDAYSGERRIHHYLVTGDPSPTRINLPDIVVVEVDDEANGPLRVFGAPRVISEPTSASQYDVGDRIEFRVVFTRPVRVTGTPYLDFELGTPSAPRMVRADYARGDGTQDLVFAYTVKFGDEDRDGITIPAGSIHLNGGAIQDVESGRQAAITYPGSGVQAAHRLRTPVGIDLFPARTVEEPGATLEFLVRLTREASVPVTVDYATADGTAIAGEDYTPVSGTLTFPPGIPPGRIEMIISVPVLDDAHDEGVETMTMILSDASGALIEFPTNSGTIFNTDPIPQAWLARFGRTVGEQVIDAVEGRLRASRTPGLEMTVAGRALGAGLAAVEDAQARSRLDAMTDRVPDGAALDGVRPGSGSRAISGRDLLMGTSFAMTGEAKGGGTVSLWGRGAHGRFDGRDGALSLDGEVSSVMLGADWTRDPGSRSGAGAWTAGLLVSRSEGEGGYRSEGDPGSGSGTGGEVGSTLTGLYPYGRYMLNDRVTLWGVAGYGAGSLTLRPQGARAIRTDMDLAMGALGLRGVAVEAGPQGGMELALKSDAMAVRTSSERTQGLAAASAEVTRLRLGLEGTWRGLALGEAGTLVPRLEIGVRHDGGDAETGFGMDLGGGLAWTDPARGIAAEVSGRGLLTHESRGFRDRGFSGSFAWQPGGGTGRGPSLTLSRTVGSSAAGGVDALFGPETMGGFAANGPGLGSRAGGNGPANRRLELRLGYGFAALGGRFTSTPELGLALSDGWRDYTVGWRLNLPRSGPSAFDLRLDVSRREAAGDNADPEHRIRLGVSVGW